MADARDKGKAREDSSTNGPQMIRITSSGKIKTYVAFALDFFEKHELAPLVFHTLPAPRTQPKPAAPSEPAPQTDAVPVANSNPPSLLNTASTVPRLISVAEIIKREYLKKLEVERSSALVGLHQYNEIGTLEELGLNVAADAQHQQVDAETLRSHEIAAALQGKTHLKNKQTPYMKITLSRVELPHLTAASYQPPLRRKLSKSAAARAKRRDKKQSMDTDGH